MLIISGRSLNMTIRDKVGMVADCAAGVGRDVARQAAQVFGWQPAYLRMLPALDVRELGVARTGGQAAPFACDVVGCMVALSAADRTEIVLVAWSQGLLLILRHSPLVVLLCSGHHRVRTLPRRLLLVPTILSWSSLMRLGVQAIDLIVLYVDIVERCHIVSTWTPSR